MEYITVYEYSFGGSKLIHIIPVLGFVLFGFGMGVMIKKWYKEYSFQRQLYIFIVNSIGFVGLILLIVLLVKAPSIIKQENILKRKIKTNDFFIVEGKVEDYKLEKHSIISGSESFNVDSVEFAYSDNYIIEGFHTTAVLGGPINRNDLHVRISYIKHGKDNYIMRIKIREDDL